jgi:hypothetical protein
MSERTTEWDPSGIAIEPNEEPGLVSDPNLGRHVETADLRTDQPIGSSDDASTGDVAKEQASDVKDSAVDAGRHVADVAKDQAQHVAGEAGRKAQDLLEQGRTELEQQASTQQERAAAGLHALGSELRSLADGATESGVVVDLAREAASRTEAIASWLEQRQPGEVLEGVRSFARQRPGTFLALAAGAGVLSARLARGIQAGPPAESAPSSDLDGGNGVGRPSTAVRPDAL